MAEQRKTHPLGMRKRIIIAIILVLIIAIVLPFAVSVVVYEQFFGNRYTSYAPLMLKVEDFEGLQRTRYEFASKQGQMLVGYLYYNENVEEKGIVVMAHGLGGGGHNSYVDSANYFAENGYYVFAYDATGNDESECGGAGGLPQGIIDLDYAIAFVEAQEEFAHLPIMLFGHSWGAYSAANVLNLHPEVKAVVSMSGMNASEDLLKEQGRQLIGDFINVLLPYVKVYERLKFDEYATFTAMEGFANSDCGVMIIHSADDDTVPIEYGYDIYYETYGDSERFRFVRLENKGHSYIDNSDVGDNYILEVNEEFAKWSENLEEFTAEVKEQYLAEHLDRKQWANMLDEELYGQIVEFYDEYSK